MSFVSILCGDAEHHSIPIGSKGSEDKDFGSVNSIQRTERAIGSNQTSDTLAILRAITESIDGVGRERGVIGWVKVSVNEDRVLPNVRNKDSLLRCNNHRSAAKDAVDACSAVTP